MVLRRLLSLVAGAMPAVIINNARLYEILGLSQRIDFVREQAGGFLMVEAITACSGGYFQSSIDPRFPFPWS
jgi:hypothetical protein